MRLIIFIIIMLISTGTLHGQKKITSTLSLMFGNLPMHLPTKKIISFAEKNKNFIGKSNYNLDLNYTGIILNSKFFNLKPDTSFIEIVSDASEFFPDSALSNTSLFLFDASYNKADSSAIKMEFQRIGSIFSPNFTSGKIIKESEIIYFYKLKEDSRPTLALYISSGKDCFTGKRCIKVTYFK